MENKLSIIIPAYNVEKYIYQCLNSVLINHDSSIECLVINDGSNDETLSICNKMREKDNRLRIITIENSGVSNARNVGINESNGEYLMFLDSDDFLVENFLDELSSLISLGKDLLCFNCATLINNRFKSESFNVDNIKKEDIYSRIFYNINKNNQFQARTVWGKVYRSSIIKENNIFFDTKQYIGEDALFNLHYLTFVNSYLFVNTVGYVYRIHNNSACRKHKDDLYVQCETELSNAISFSLMHMYNNNADFYCLSLSLFRAIIKNYKNINVAKKWYKERVIPLYEKNLIIGNRSSIRIRITYKLSKVLPFFLVYQIFKI